MQKTLRQGRRSTFAILACLFFIMIEPYTYLSMYQLGQVEGMLLLAAFLLIGSLIVTKEGSVHLGRLNKEQFCFVFLLIALILFSMFINLDLSNNIYFALILRMLLAYLFVNCFTAEEFRFGYVGAMKFLAVYSVVATYLLLLFPMFQNIFPSFLHYGEVFYGGSIRFINTYFCNVYIPSFGVQFRNYGIFREPGVYQFYLFCAMILDVFESRENEKGNVRRFMLWSVAIITTLSTTAIVVLGFVLSSYVLLGKATVRTKVLSIAGVAVGLTLIFSNDLMSSLLQQSLSKLSGGGSYTSRTGSLVAYFLSWVERPIAGWGYTDAVFGEGAKYIIDITQHNTNTTFFNMAVFGTAYGVITTLGFVCFFRRWKVHLLIVAALLISMNTQRFFESPVLFAMIFYGFSALPKRRAHNNAYGKAV